MAVLKTATPRFLADRTWDQWSWRQHFRADLSARVRMLWGPLVQSFGGCNDQHNWRACVVCPEGRQNWMIEKCKLSARLRDGQLYLLLEPRSGSACMVFWFASTSRKFHDVHILMIWADLMEGPGIAWFTNGSTVRLYVWLKPVKELHDWFLFTQEPRPGWGPTYWIIGLGPRHRPTALFACTMGGQTCRI